MSETTREIVYMLDILPEQDRQLAYELVKKMVLAWDPDYTKLTDQERERLELAEKEIANGECIDHNAINWD